MRLRKFTAPDIASAMRMVRENLGDEAIILHTAHDRLRRTVAITAAFDEEAPARPVEKLPEPQPAADRSARSGRYTDEVRRILRFNNMPETLISLLLEKEPSGRDVASTVTEVLAQHFQFQPLPLLSPGYRFALIGPPGIGKTLTVAKLAAQLVLDKHDVQLISTDNKRAGGVEQLDAFARLLGIKLLVADNKQELWQMLQELPKTSRVIIDTAGCNPYLRDELAELSDLLSAGTFEPVLVLPAGTDASEAVDTAQSFDFPGIKRLLPTRLDTARRYGSLLAAAHARGLALSHAASSSHIKGGLKEITPDLLTALLMQYRLQT